MDVLQSLQRRGKRLGVAVLARPLLRQGFVSAAARSWVRELYQDWRNPARDRAQLRQAHRYGFASDAYTLVQQRDVRQSAPISQRDYAALRPLNARKPWLRSRIVARRTIPGLAEHLPEPLAVLARRYGRVELTPLQDSAHEPSASVAEVIALVRSHGSVRLLPLAWAHGGGAVLTWTEGGVAFDDRPIAADDLESVLAQLTARQRWLITDNPSAANLLASSTGLADAVLRLHVGRRRGSDAQVLDAEVHVLEVEREPLEGELPRPRVRPYVGAERFGVDRHSGEVISPGDGSVVITIPDFANLVAEAERLFSQPAAQFSFVAVDVAVTATGALNVVDIHPAPPYPSGRLFDDDANVYLGDLFAARASSRRRRASRRFPKRRARGRRGLLRRWNGFHLRAEGFTGRAARTWLDLVERDRRKNGRFSKEERARAYEWGFTPALVANLGITEQNRSQFISLRDYLYARPLNGKYEKWVRDRVSALMVFAPFSEYFDTVHYQLVRHGGQLRIIAISPQARAAGATIRDVAAVVAEHGPLRLAAVGWRAGSRAKVSAEGAELDVGGVRCGPGELGELLSAQMDDRTFVLREPPRIDQGLSVRLTMMNPDGAHPVVAEAFADVAADPADGTAGAGTRYISRLDPETGSYQDARAMIDGQVHTFTQHPQNGEGFSGTVVGWPHLVDTLTRMCQFAPQLRFIQLTIRVSDQGFVITRVAATPTYSTIFPFAPETVAFLKESIEHKKELAHRTDARVQKGLHNAKLKLRREFAAALYPKGLVPYQSVRWPGDVRRDLLQPNGIPLATKFWAYRNGFLSYRIPQYGITPENREDYISDFEYRWLRHINEQYKYWLEDKVSIKYVGADFNEFLPAYYFYTSRSRGRNHVVPMMDCPEGYGAEYHDVLRLAREKGKLALKPDEGSHGEGFYRLGWVDGHYSLNGESATEDTVIAILADPKNRYLITEFIEMHPTIARIYPTSVNTIRMIVFKRDGVTPQLGNAYLRIGSSASGYVDNTAAGGMLAEIEVETGRFGNAQVLQRGRVRPCPHHPDTGVAIEGVVPNWDFVKRQILKMAENFTQLEYLGFDVAITEDGFKIPEINRFPDYPRIDLLTPETIDYLLMKVDQKKRRYGYHRRRPRTLISLPRRD